MERTGTSPLTARRKLGAELRTLRNEAVLTAEEVGDQIGCHESKISRVETGKRSCTLTELGQLVKLYGVEGEHKARMEELCKYARRKVAPWWDTYADVITANYAEFIAYEAEASGSFEYQAVLVPGQLQTEEYARAVIAVGFVALGPDQVDSLTEVRVRRQRRLRDDNPLTLDAVVSEAALHFRVAGRDAQRQQLRHLREIADLPNVSIRVIPYEKGAAGTCTGSFNIFKFHGETNPDAAFAESVAGGNQFVEGEFNLRRLNRLFFNISRHALDASDSLTLINRIEREI